MTVHILDWLYAKAWSHTRRNHPRTLKVELCTNKHRLSPNKLLLLCKLLDQLLLLTLDIGLVNTLSATIEKTEISFQAQFLSNTHLFLKSLIPIGAVLSFFITIHGKISLISARK